MKTILGIGLLALFAVNAYNYNNPNPIFVVTVDNTKPIVDVTPKSTFVLGDTKPWPKSSVKRLNAIKEKHRSENKIETVKPVVSKKTKKFGNAYTEQYIQDHILLAKEMEKLYGVPAELCLAQAIYESASGESYLAKNCNNHHGIKAMKGFRSYQGTSAKWSIFESVDESYINYARIVNRLIKSLYPNGFDWSKITPWDIAKTAYAGKNNWDYANKCESIISQYNIKELVQNN